jgi:hypothetical protein
MEKGPAPAVYRRNLMPDPFTPSPSLLSKLGSIAVHVEELLGPTGHTFDKSALDSVLADPEVREWLAAMARMAMLPVRR